jgi:hypothetical protein
MKEAVPQFNEDMIRRSDIPADAMSLIHDIAYHHQGRDAAGGTPHDYVNRAQEILKRKQSPYVKGYSASASRRPVSKPDTRDWELGDSNDFVQEDCRAQPETTVVHVPIPEGNESSYVKALREQSQPAAVPPEQLTGTDNLRPNPYELTPKPKCRFGVDTCDGINGTSGFICRDCVEDAEWEGDGGTAPTAETSPPVPPGQWMLEAADEIYDHGPDLTLDAVESLIQRHYKPVAEAHAQEYQAMKQSFQGWRKRAEAAESALKEMDGKHLQVVGCHVEWRKAAEERAITAESALRARDAELLKAKKYIAELERECNLAWSMGHEEYETLSKSAKIRDEAVRRLCEAVQLAINCNSCRPCSESLAAALADVEAAGGK